MASLSLQPHPSFTGRPGPVLVVVADGVGVAPPGSSNAVTQARTPMLERLTSTELYTELAAHGPAVGLPTDDDMGNSEVGHNALGAGRIFAQGAKLVNKAIANGAIFESEVWVETVDRARTGTLHLIGLHSDGGVHSSLDHLDALIRNAAAEGVTSCAVHILHDGRDVDARSALTYIDRTEAVLADINAAAPGRNYRIASGGGRMKITMDRYEADWPMVERGYRCHVHGEGRPFSSARDAVETMYAESEAGDQYLGEFVAVDENGVPVGEIVDGDAVVFFNFRGDRAIEISRSLEEPDFDVFDRTGVDGRPHPDISFAGMLQYDGDALVPKRYLVSPPAIDRVMGEFLCGEGVRTFAISETQKYGHVTYFWNGNRSGYIDETLETYIEIPSDNVEFDTTPAMKVREITDETIDLLRSGEYRFGRLNFPSGDMVGHTGHLHATVEAMEIIDECMARLVEVIDELGGVLIYTADHGNADIMFTETSSGERLPKTSHTLSPVPFAIHDPNYDGEYHMNGGAPAANHGLANVASTVFNLLGYEAPTDYLPSLIDF
ncbi:2,3-bisphosphoglycerate-independent phosphoglycerate mutase [Ilumatobacter nonamiensis]|uniref:2,3-bisphosphoglycerate-independent phosphoglycerate mutase n=1 Tax=Ilumatobacter nonamiensis TaxID=467093 RepID=UPI000349E8EC|nr:2,3-bisphosphoglycerate-independent phosphoglycerate mutase [Ilumatobacter nonamiensis]